MKSLSASFLEHLRIEFTLEADHFEEIQKQLANSICGPSQPVYQTEFLPFDNNFFEVDLDLLPRTATISRSPSAPPIRECISSSNYFETGKWRNPS